MEYALEPIGNRILVPLFSKFRETGEFSQNVTLIYFYKNLHAFVIGRNKAQNNNNRITR